MPTAQHLSIAAKMYETRDALKRLTGGSFPERIAEYQDYIKGAAKNWGMDILPTTLWLCEAIKRLQDAEVTQMWLVAAAVELLEPSE